MAPGETAVAVYSFAIPDTEVGDVTLTVDVDGFRYPVVCTGAAPAG